MGRHVAVVGRITVECVVCGERVTRPAHLGSSSTCGAAECRRELTRRTKRDNGTAPVGVEEIVEARKAQLWEELREYGHATPQTTLIAAIVLKKAGWGQAQRFVRSLGRRRMEVEA